MAHFLQPDCARLRSHFFFPLFDTPVRPILCYCCEIWYVRGGKTALDDLERIERIFFFKTLSGAQVHTKTCHVLAEFGRYPLHVTCQLHAANYPVVCNLILACGICSSMLTAEQAEANATGKPNRLSMLIAGS